MEVDRAVAVLRQLRQELAKELSLSDPSYRGPDARVYDTYIRAALQERIQALDVVYVTLTTEGTGHG